MLIISLNNNNNNRDPLGIHATSIVGYSLTTIYTIIVWLLFSSCHFLRTWILMPLNMWGIYQLYLWMKEVFSSTFFVLLFFLFCCFLSWIYPKQLRSYQLISEWRTMETYGKTNTKFWTEIQEILAHHDSNFEQLHLTLQTILTELQSQCVQKVQQAIECDAHSLHHGCTSLNRPIHIMGIHLWI